MHIEVVAMTEVELLNGSCCHVIMPPPPPDAGRSSSSSLLDRKPSLPVPSLPSFADGSSASVFLANLFTYSANAHPSTVVGVRSELELTHAQQGIAGCRSKQHPKATAVPRLTGLFPMRYVRYHRLPLYKRSPCGYMHDPSSSGWRTKAMYCEKYWRNRIMFS